MTPSGAGLPFPVELFGGLADGVCISGPGGRILYMNEAAERLMRLSSVFSKPYRLCDLLCGRMRGPDGKDCASGCPLLDPAAGARSAALKGAHAPDPAEPRAPLRVRCFEVGGTAEGGPYHLTFLQDSAAEEAEELRKEDWRSMVVHDLQSPATAVVSGLHLLLQGKEAERLSPGQRELLELAKRSSERLLALARQYLDADRLARGRLPVRPERVPLGPLLARVAEQLGPAAQARGVSLRRRAARGLSAWADPELLRRVLENLADNAVRWSPGGAAVRLGAAASGAGVVLSVSDKGPGIPKEELARLFEPYRRPRSPGRSLPGGFGLGLAFCRRAALAMGGELDLSTEAGKGTTFTLRLPAPPDP